MQQEENNFRRQRINLFMSIMMIFLESLNLRNVEQEIFTQIQLLKSKELCKSLRQNYNKGIKKSKKRKRRECMKILIALKMRILTVQLIAKREEELKNYKALQQNSTNKNQILVLTSCQDRWEIKIRKRISKKE